MCLGIPMRVETAAPGTALCVGRAGRRAIATLLVGDCAPGEWLLTFLDDARERISAERAGEIDAVLDLLEQINRMGTTLIMVTHDPELANRARRRVHLVDGKISDAAH